MELHSPDQIGQRKGRKEQRSSEMGSTKTWRDREAQSTQKRPRVNENRMVCYHRVNADRRAAHEAKTEKAIQAEVAFQASCTSSPYPTKKAFCRLWQESGQSPKLLERNLYSFSKV